MGSIPVDQIRPDGSFVEDADTTLRESEKDELLIAALPGATAERFEGTRVIRFRDQLILRAQITHLGRPWPGYKKRIQIPKPWPLVVEAARAEGLVPRFVGIYRYGEVTVFVDFDPTTYVQRKANNSAAHVSTNDLYQAQTLGQFARQDRNGNSLTSVRADVFAEYLKGTIVTNPRLEVFGRFNAEFLDAREIGWEEALEQMYALDWPDKAQGEWPGFYLECRLDSFIRAQGLSHLAQFQKSKTKGAYDYDLVFPSGAGVEFYGDLKASNLDAKESPGNDLVDLERCIEEFGRFWYVIYEHETKHAKHHGDVATSAWNEWRRERGHVPSSGKFDPLSYRTRFKESVRFAKMIVLEVNQANWQHVFRDFHQGKQTSGASRAIKVMIKKKVIDNYLVFWAAAPGRDEAGGLGDVEKLIEG